jgi:hypothetical protein
MSNNYTKLCEEEAGNVLFIKASLVDLTAAILRLCEINYNKTGKSLNQKIYSDLFIQLVDEEKFNMFVKVFELYESFKSFDFSDPLLESFKRDTYNQKLLINTPIRTLIKRFCLKLNYIIEKLFNPKNNLKYENWDSQKVKYNNKQSKELIQYANDLLILYNYFDDDFIKNFIDNYKKMIEYHQQEYNKIIEKINKKNEEFVPKEKKVRKLYN